MNVFSLLNHFFWENEREKVSSSATKLYFFLIYEANKSYWEGPLMFSERKLSSLLSFSKNTVSKCLSELEDRGLIMCYPRRVNSLTAHKEGGLTANKEDSLTANEVGSLTANEEGGLMTNKGDSLKLPERGPRKDDLTANKKDSLTANKKDSLTANKGDSLTANKGDSLKRAERGQRKDSLTADVEGKGASANAFWFADVQYRETASNDPKGVQGKTASRQVRKEKNEVYDKGMGYNVHRGENSLTANKGNSLKNLERGSIKGNFRVNKGESKYAKFF